MSSSDNFCPYVGLQPYTEQDSAFFFGRERDQRIITSNLYAARLTVLYGASGVGKSSILMAGLVPYLRTKSRTAVVVFREWQNSTFLAELKHACALAIELVQKKPLRADVNQPLDDFLCEAAAEFRGSILILLDQFEEYFLYYPETHWKDGFDIEFVRAVNREDVDASFLISLREDSLSQLDRYRARIPNLLGNTLRLTHLDATAAVAAIRKPLDVYNARYPERAVAIEDALVIETIAQVRTGQVTIGDGGAGQTQAIERSRTIETPFLQLVLTRLWEEELRAAPTLPPRPADAISRTRTGVTNTIGDASRRMGDSIFRPRAQALAEAPQRTLRLSTLQRLGGAGQIVRTHLDRVMDRLGGTEQEICSTFFDRLVTPSGAKIAQISDDLINWANRPAQQIEPILKSLVDARVLRTTAPPLDKPTAIRYEIFHDVLGPSVLAWRGHFVEHQKQAQERVRARRLGWAVIGATTLTLIFAVLAFIAINNANAAQLAQAEADQKRAAAELANSEAAVRLLMKQSKENLATNPSRSLLLAAEAFQLVQKFGAGTQSFINNIQSAEDILRNEVFQTHGRALSGHSDLIWAVALSPDSEWIATSSRDKSVRLWRVANLPALGQLATSADASILLKGHERDARTLAFSPDNRWLATGSDDGTARLWNLTSLAPDASPVILRGHTRDIRVLAFSPDGRWLVTGSRDRTARVWNLRAADIAAQPIVLSAHTEQILAVAISPNSRWVVTGADDNLAHVWDLAARDPSVASRILRGHSDQVNLAAFSPDNRWVVTASADSTARAWDMNAPDPSQAFKILFGHQEPILSLAFIPDGNLLATGGFDTTARLWNLDLPDPSASSIELRAHNDQVSSVAFTPDRRFLITASRDATIALWDFSMSDPSIAPIILRGHEGPVRQIVVSAEGRFLISAGEDSTARMWGLTQPLFPNDPVTLSGHTSVARLTTFSPDNRWLATGSGDGTVRLWDITSQDPAASPIILRGHTSAIFALGISNDSRWLASGSQDANIFLWNLGTIYQNSKPIILRGHTESLRTLDFSPNNRWLVSAGRDAIIRIWDLSKPTAPSIALSGHADQIRILKISPDSRWLISGGDDGAPRLWDLTAADIARSAIPLAGHIGSIRAAAYSPDSRWLATGGDDRAIRLWDLKSNSITESAFKDSARVLDGHAQVIRALTFTPDQKFLISASGDQTMRLWEMKGNATPATRFILKEHTGEVRALATSNDSRYLISGSEDSTARVWDLSAADPTTRSIVLPGHVGPVWAVAVSPDNEWIATVSGDRTGRLWKITTQSEVNALVCQRVARNLSPAEWKLYFGALPYRQTCRNLPTPSAAP